jgi:hypothetical protein
LNHFYLRTINKLEIQVTQTNSDEYLVSAMNIPMPLSIDISTDSGKQKTIFNDNKPVKIKSLSQPIIDTNGYYLKKVVFQ